jgi:tRNA A-37 threonylcarbamoyl transferase component Bud32
MIYPSEAVTAEGVRRWLLNRLGDAGQCIVKGPVYQRQNSHIFYAECDALPSAAAIKWCLQTYTPRPDSDSAVRQFEALRRVADAMQADPRYTVPRPYLLDRERALLAIEWIGGAPMTASMASWRCGADNAHDLMVQAGNWLRHFHQAHRLPDGPLDVEDKLRSASEYDDCALARDQVFAQGLADLRRSAAAAASVNLERSWIHGDFKTDNLIISGQRIVGIDVQIRHENTVVYDVAPFLNDLELSFCHPMAWRPASVRARLIAAFVRAADRECFGSVLHRGPPALSASQKSGNELPHSKRSA